MEYAFADCVLDTRGHHLRRGGEEVHVEPQVFALLELLAARPGEVVSRDDILAAVWNGRIVSEATISSRISAARAAVGDDGRRQGVIETVARVGLRLAVPVEAREGDAEPVVSPEPIAIPKRGTDVRYTQSADGSGIAWASEGEGPPLLRAGHWMTNLETDRENPIWGAWIERLGAGRQLVRYDFRGTGLSDPECGEFTLARLAEDMEAVIEAAGLESFDVFCASQSTAVALVYAKKNPGRIRRLVSYGGWPQGSSKRSQDGTAMTSALATLLRLGWGQPAGGYMKSFVSLFIPGASEAEAAALVASQMASATADRAVEIRNAIAEFDIVDLLPEIDVETLVIHSREDSLHPFAQAQILAQRLPNAALRVLQSKNHVLLPSEPDFERMMDMVDEFLAD